MAATAALEASPAVGRNDRRHCGSLEVDADDGAGVGESVTTCPGSITDTLGCAPTSTAPLLHAEMANINPARDTASRAGAVVWRRGRGRTTLMRRLVFPITRSPFSRVPIGAVIGTPPAAG
jgi:hypothetical protein